MRSPLSWELRGAVFGRCCGAVAVAEAVAVPVANGLNAPDQSVTGTRKTAARNANLLLVELDVLEFLDDLVRVDVCVLQFLL